MTVSNRRPPTCKDGALPTELIALKTDFDQYRELGYRHLYFTTRGLVGSSCERTSKARQNLAFWISYVNTSARPISAWAPPRRPVKASITLHRTHVGPTLIIQLFIKVQALAPASGSPRLRCLDGCSSHSIYHCCFSTIPFYVG